jgi:hypothetical protein
MAIDKKNIRNYTSEADAATSQMKIEQMVLKSGARNIAKQYDGFGNCSSINFILPVNNMQLTFALEAKVDLVQEFMLKQYEKTPTAAQKEACRKQATRTAWKNLLELIQIQLDMVAIEQIDLMQALLPILSDGTQTFFERLKRSDFKLLLNK